MLGKRLHRIVRRIIAKQKFIDFSHEDIESLRKQLHLNQSIFITKTGKEVGKYSKGQIVNSLFGRLLIKEVFIFKDLKTHPFYNQLSKNEIKILSFYHPPYEAIILEKAYKPYFSS